MVVCLEVLLQVTLPLGRILARLAHERFLARMHSHVPAQFCWTVAHEVTLLARVVVAVVVDVVVVVVDEVVVI